MTTPDTRAALGAYDGALTDYLPGDPFQTKLISRLANEIYAEFDRGSDAPVPNAALPWLDSATLSETAIPTSVLGPAGLAPGLPEPPVAHPYYAHSAGFPAPASADPRGVAHVAPPVHPVIEPLAEHAPADSIPALGDLLRAAGADSPSFGRPGQVPSGGDRRWSRIPVVDSPAGADPYASVDFYFLSPGTSRNPTGGSVPHRSAFTPAGKSNTGGLAGFDVEKVRRDFPALHQNVNGKPLVWLDNAATTHKPQSVIDATSEYYARHNSNIHRAAHTLAERSTDLFEGAREKLRRFIGAAEAREIVFVRGTTEAINLVANSFGQKHIGPGDEIIVSTIEHHANIVPWQLLAERTGAVLRVAPVNDRGELILEHFAALLGGRTKLVSITHVANALGTINPIAEIIALSHAHGVPVLVDAAQSSPHIPLNVQALGADFLVLSGHKVFGPTGIGILYGKAALLESLPPWQGGGHMIKDVTFAKTIFNGIPEKFEAGTPDIAGAVGLGAAVDYLEGVGLPAIEAYEHDLLAYATDAISTVKELRIIGTAHHKASVLSFVIKDRETEEIAKFLNKQGIATRSGHHCAQPALRRFGVETSVRASLAFYNTREDVDALVRALHAPPEALRRPWRPSSPPPPCASGSRPRAGSPSSMCALRRNTPRFTFRRPATCRSTASTRPRWRPRASSTRSGRSM
ncbi:SufS family cysteine desulfurase [Xanthobacter sp. VNH20]|uniref:SufS family cysteine desulfurase n=1 Tax=Xanthobacter sp. VNH20 TaxID=3156616 RepID=UPI0032B452C0